MFFNSIQYFIFLFIVVALYFSMPYKLRWIILLAGSYFYMNGPVEYMFLLLALTVFNYFLAIYIHKSVKKEVKKIGLLIGIFINIGALLYFKYFLFFTDSFLKVLKLFQFELPFSLPTIILPLGISFFIFKILSYIIDVYWGKIEPEKHFGIFATYVSFFPSLLSGPIDRAKNFIPQLYQENSLDIERIINGLKLIALGLLKKIVIADRLAIIINKIFNNVESYSGPYFLVAAFLFGFQLYCDFSGYVDIAIGSAKIFGITLSENFNRPFTATSIADFWRRWHITLSSWFQDYVFKPLYMGIARSSWINGMSPRFRHNLSFTLSTMIGLALLGLWHGADWTYVLFGLYHGTMIAAYYLTKKYWDKMHRSVRIFFSFFLVTAGWVFFKANSIYDILYIFENMGSGWSLGVLNDLIIYIGYKPLIYVILYIVFVEWLQKIQEKSQQFLPIPNIIMRWGIYYFILFSILLLGVFNANPGFIYFKF